MPAPKGHKPYNTKGEGGVPKKYTQAWLEKEADLFEQWLKIEENFYFKEFALMRDYHPNRLAEFAEASERFAGVYKKAIELQETRLVKNALYNTFNAGFTKFVLSNRHGWSENQQDVTNGDKIINIIQRND